MIEELLRPGWWKLYRFVSSQVRAHGSKEGGVRRRHALEGGGGGWGAFRGRFPFLGFLYSREFSREYNYREGGFSQRTDFPNWRTGLGFPGCRPFHSNRFCSPKWPIKFARRAQPLSNRQ